MIQLSPQNVRFPRASGLEPIAVRPARLKVTLERTAAKEVPIRVVTRGEPGVGIDVYGIALMPPTATISGPRSSIEKMRDVATEPVALADQRVSIRKFLNLDIRDDAVHSIPSGPVQVTIELGPHRRLQKVAKIPVVCKDDTLAVSPRWITIQVLVPISYTRVLIAAEFSAAVNVPDPASVQAPVKIKPEVRLKDPGDPAIVIKDVQPAEVTVRKKPR